MSSPPLRIFLTSAENQTLWELNRAEGVPLRTRDWAANLRLSSMGWKVEQIGKYLNWSIKTVRATIHRWEKQGLAGLWDAPRPGRKRKWSQADLAEIEKKLETEERAYNSRQLVKYLAQERQVKLSQRQLRRILKKNYRWKRTRTSLKGKQDQEKRATKRNDLEMLEFAAAAGEICLKYLDESGFSLWAEPVYTWGKIGQQKQIKQPKKKGKRLNICGFLAVGESFEYGLSFKSFDSKNYIKLMDWQAAQAETRLKETGKITVIVQDQYSVHVSKLTKSNYDQWEKQGLYIFLLSSYSPELNLIETEWERIKEDELAGQMFENEYELTIAVRAAIEARQTSKGLEVKRFRFGGQPSQDEQKS